MIHVNEIFFDIQDSGTFLGFPSVFIHLHPGNPASSYTTIDPKLALTQGKKFPVEAILDEVSKYNCYIVVIAGKEPLEEKLLGKLISSFADKNYLVLLETPGSKTIKEVNSKAIVAINLFCPDCKEEQNFLLENLPYLRTRDQLKIYIASSKDYHWAKELIFKEMLFEKCNILFFPYKKTVAPKTLTDWIITDQLPVRMGVKIKNYFLSD